MLKKVGLLTTLLAATFMMAACGKKESPTVITDNTLIISSDNKVTGVFVDVFDRDYYSQEGLQSMVEAEALAYNQSAGADKISFDKIEESEDHVVKLYMNYADAASFSEYNEVPLFVGTVSEAYDAGYQLNVKLHSLDGSKTIDKDGILQLGKNHIAILGETYYVELPSEVLYISDGIEKTSKKKEVQANFDQELVYIIYK